MEEALSTARACAAAATATGSCLDSTFGAMVITVAESKPAYDVQDNHERSPSCIYCQRFRSAAQRCGHNSPVISRDPVGTGRLIDKQTEVLPLRGEECRLPLDLTFPHKSKNPLLSTEFVIHLRQDLLKTHQLTREYLATAENCQKDYYDCSVRGSPLQPGEQVYLLTPTPPLGAPAKLHKEWVSPYIVRETYNETT
ncbi:hypothetical protein PHET_12186 [Paragonimus heterotremus]|uniref:Uncharacterized protein n=1 Tax=Paragonimus heterotremus TaxID=100268 RepID=A0A8J4WS62_9TREM|nr:hypothetical protein PHET_12186 [Paragonimus heterotremus]